jgi:hypothetical protein
MGHCQSPLIESNNTQTAQRNRPCCGQNAKQKITHHSGITITLQTAIQTSSCSFQFNIEQPCIFLLLNITNPPPSPSPPRPQNLPPVQALYLFRLIVHQIPAPCSRSPITPRAQARARPRRERRSLVAIDQIANGFPVRHGTSWRRGLWLCFLHLRRWVITVLCLWRWS